MYRTVRVQDHTFIEALLVPGTTVIDLGVNHGKFCDYLLDNTDVDVVGLEPVPALWNEAVRRFDYTSRVKLLRLAVADATGTVTLGLSPGADASVLFREASGEQRLVVESISLTDLLDKYAPGPISMLKLDIEGAEVPALGNTPADRLLRCSQIVVEYHDFLFPELSSAVKECRNRLRELGFYEFKSSLDATDILYVNPEIDITLLDEIAFQGIRIVRGVRRRLDRLASTLR